MLAVMQREMRGILIALLFVAVVIELVVGDLALEQIVVPGHLRQNERIDVAAPLDIESAIGVGGSRRRSRCNWS